MLSSKYWHDSGGRAKSFVPYSSQDSKFSVILIYEDSTTQPQARNNNDLGYKSLNPETPGSLLRGPYTKRGRP